MRRWLVSIVFVEGDTPQEIAWPKADVVPMTLTAPDDIEGLPFFRGVES